MRTVSLLIGSVFLVCTLASRRACAQDSATISDARCVVVALKLMDMSDPNIQTNGQSAMLYYLGRLDGRDEKLDLESLLMQQLAQMKEADYKTEAHRCGEKMIVRGQQIFKIGQDIEKRGREQQDLPR